MFSAPVGLCLEMLQIVVEIKDKRIWKVKTQYMTLSNLLLSLKLLQVSECSEVCSCNETK